MEVYQKNFLEIIKSAVHDLPIHLSAPNDYEKILNLAREQNLLALVGEKLCEYKDFITAPEYLKTIADTIGSVACQAARTASFLDLHQAFEDAGLAPIVMKGILCRVLYGKYQDHRPSSDEDILIRQEDFPLLCQVMASKGFTAENDTVTPQMLETLQEITFYDRQGGLHIEVHTNPMGHNTYVHQKMNTYFKDVFSKKFCVTIDGTKIWTMRPTDHLLFLILHALKHLMSSGFGIRQALDIYLFIQKYSADIDWDYISTSLKENQGESFFADLICIGNRYLGFHITVPYKSKSASFTDSAKASTACHGKNSLLYSFGLPYPVC